MNVCEEAIRNQDRSMIYGHPDHWEAKHLDPGTKLYQLDMGNMSGGFFIDEETYHKYLDEETGAFDVKRYCNDAEIAPYFDGTYKNHISEYEVGPEGLDVAYGICSENKALGTGGCSQVYVAEEDREQLEKTGYGLDISDEDRTIGTEKSNEIISNAVESNLPALGYTTREEDTMRSLADEEGLPPTSQTNAVGNEQAQTKDNSMGIE